jgi:predicted Zn-dependent protease
MSPASIAARLLLLGICAGASISASAIEEREQRARIDLETRELEGQIANSGRLYGDAELDAYLQSVVDRLFPDKVGQLHVRVYRDTDFNAFAVSTGDIYFNTGTFLRLADEAQLATVLGHEGTHVTADHMYRTIRSAKSTSVITRVVAGAAYAASGVDPTLVQMVGVSTMMGFSRDFEREADRGGFDRMAAAGYDGTAGAEIWDRLERELKIRKIPRAPYFFASHPAVHERLLTLAELSRARGLGGQRQVDQYRARTQKVRMDVLADIHREGDGKLLVFLLDTEKMLDGLPAEARFYLAEGLRFRNADGDAQRSVAEYELTLTQAPDFGPTYYALGMQCLRAGDKPRALSLFQAFLERDPQSQHVAYARSYVEQLKKDLGQ